MSLSLFLADGSYGGSKSGRRTSSSSSNNTTIPEEMDVALPSSAGSSVVGRHRLSVDSANDPGRGLAQWSRERFEDSRRLRKWAQKVKTIIFRVKPWQGFG